MDLAQEKLDLIAKVIKNDRKFSDNEDLYDDFFNETCKRSLGIVNVITSDVTLEAYLRKIATTSILNVLKDSGRLRRTKGGYRATNNVSIDETDSLNQYSNAKISYDNFVIEETPEEIIVRDETLKQVATVILTIDNEEPEKQYLQIYKLRYDKGMTQKEISEELGLSQSEISKRLFKLMRKVKQSFR